MKLRWEHVHIGTAALRLPGSKAGANVVHLGQAAVDALAATGFTATIPLPLERGSLLWVALPVGRMPEAIVIRVDERKVACEFVTPLNAPEMDVMSDLWGRAADKVGRVSSVRYSLL